MRLRPGTALVAAAVLVGGGAVGCTTAIEGNGSIAAEVITSLPSPSDTGSSGAPSSDSPSPSESSSSPTPSPTPSTDPVSVRRRVLCVLEQASIASINTQFNKTKDRNAQIRILGQGVTTINGHLSRSGLPGSDRIRVSGQAVATQLTSFYKSASAGGNPSPSGYNTASEAFQKACTTIS